MFALRACTRAMVALPCAAAVVKSTPALCAAKVHSSAPRQQKLDRYDTLDSNPELRPLFENNRKWVEECLAEDPEFFKKLQKGQKPQFLFIGCADSRVPAQSILGLKAGELFVHRNVANLVVNGDLNLLAVLQYAVEVLEVQDIIVCGHYGCGGVKAATLNKDHGLLEHWLRNVRDVVRKYRKELALIEDEELRYQRLVELNVQEQCLNLYRNPVVQRQQAQTNLPRIHGFVYDIANGILKKLKIDFATLLESEAPIYKVYEKNDNDGNGESAW